MKNSLTAFFYTACLMLLTIGGASHAAQVSDDPLDALFSDVIESPQAEDTLPEAEKAPADIDTVSPDREEELVEQPTAAENSESNPTEMAVEGKGEDLAVIFIESGDAEKIKQFNIRKLVIPFFQVEFLYAMDKSTLISNPDREMMQLVTDAFYREFVNQLSAADFEVVTDDELVKTGMYKQINTIDNPRKGATDYSKKGRSYTFSPASLSLYYPMANMNPDRGQLAGALDQTNPKMEAEIGKYFGGNAEGVGVVRVHVFTAFTDFSMKLLGDDPKTAEQIFSAHLAVLDTSNVTIMYDVGKLRAFGGGRSSYYLKRGARFALTESLFSRGEVEADITNLSRLDLLDGEQAGELLGDIGGAGVVGSLESQARIDQNHFKTAGVELAERFSLHMQSKIRHTLR